MIFSQTYNQKNKKKVNTSAVLYTCCVNNPTLFINTN